MLTWLRRRLHGKKPFNEKGSGYRDALIWESVLELAARVEGNVVLVSPDTDFRDGQSNLHGDLIEDLVDLNLSLDKITLATSLSTLVDKYVRPKLGTVPWEGPLQILARRGIHLEDAVGLIIQEACLGREWEPLELRLPWQCESPTLDIVEGVSDLTFVDIRQLPPSRILIKMEAKIEGYFGVFCLQTGLVCLRRL